MGQPRESEAGDQIGPDDNRKSWGHVTPSGASDIILMKNTRPATLSHNSAGKSCAMRNLSLTLVVPCYNEETRLDTSAFLEWVSARPSRHLRFVDDASTDHTAAVLDHLCEQHSRISVLHLSRNHGKAGAVRAGILEDPRERPDRLLGCRSGHATQGG